MFLQVFHCADAFATIVVVDSQEGRPRNIPFELQPVTEEEKLRLEVWGGTQTCGGVKGGNCANSPYSCWSVLVACGRSAQLMATAVAAIVFLVRRTVEQLLM